MARPVLLTDGAARDLDEWYASAYARGGAALAARILDAFEVVVEDIAADSLTSVVVPELRQFGRRAERQVVTTDGLRVVFRVNLGVVEVVLLAPEKRSFQALLERRLLDG